MARVAIQQAVVPCGGLGTRMRALTHGAPKEMLPIGGEPLIGWVARECAASGISTIHVVIAPGKEAIPEYLAPRAGAPGYPGHILFVEQPAPLGLADAVARGWANSDEPVAVALPDNLFIAAEPVLSQVITAYYRTGLNVVAIASVDAADAARRGPTAVYQGHDREDMFEITRIPNKRDRGGSFDTGGLAVAHTGVGRYLFLPETRMIIDELDASLPAAAERDDVPVLQRLLDRGRLVGRLVHGEFLDVGLPAGYDEAALRMGGSAESGPPS
jgi:UTP--glucose-1-phosphate uridylyltransferase